MQAEPKEVSADKATTATEQLLRPANGKARRFLVKRSDLHLLGDLEQGIDCVCLVPVDDHDHLLKELFTGQRRYRALLATLRNSFPLLDDNGLDETDQHCEWHIQQERKRLHAILDGTTDAPQQVEADEWTHAKPTQPGAYWIRGNLLMEPALVQVKTDRGQLWCNLHMSTTEPDFRHGFCIAQLSDQFEWIGPMGCVPTARRPSAGGGQ